MDEIGPARVAELSRPENRGPPGEKHWHGAAPTTAMTHIAIQEQLDGKTVDWMEKVSDEQYQGQHRTEELKERTIRTSRN
jgi:hypothetical protein